MVKQLETVALISPQYAPAIGGVEWCVERLAHGLSKRGVDVQVITTDPSGRLPSVEEIEGIRVYRFPTLFSDNIYFLSPKLAGWLSKNARRYTLIHAHSYHTPLAFQAAVISRYYRLPFVVTTYFHGSGHTPFRNLLHLPYRLFGGWMLRQADQLICISKSEQILLHTRFGDALSSTVIPVGIEGEKIQKTEAVKRNPGKRIVLVVTRLEQYKQVDRLVRALLYLPPDYRVVIIGKGPVQAGIESLACALKVDGRIHMFGSLPRAELLQWYRSADVFVSLSQKESFGIAVLEAAAAGLPVVLSDIPAHRELASYLSKDGVSFVDPACSPAELAQAIQPLHAQFSMAKCKLKLPTWEENVEMTLACYHAALERKYSMKEVVVGE